MPRHPPQRAVLEEHVGIDDQHRLGPRLGEDLCDAVVERVRLPLPALFAAQMPHARRLARVPRPARCPASHPSTHRRRHRPGCAPRVVHREQPLDRRADDVRLRSMPGRRWPRADRTGCRPLVADAKRCSPIDGELHQRRQQRQRADIDEGPTQMAIEIALPPSRRQRSSATAAATAISAGAHAHDHAGAEARRVAPPPRCRQASVS